MESSKQITWQQFEIDLKSISFDRVIQKLAEQPFWSLQHAKTACQQYQRFLFLIKKYGKNYRLSPSKEIDAFWHQHVLCTKQYHHDCQIIFGKYLHHYPFLKKESRKILSKGPHPFEITQKIYCQEFGEYIYEIRFVMLFNRLFGWCRVLIEKLLRFTCFSKFKLIEDKYYEKN
jgi:hypothetical protein